MPKIAAFLWMKSGVLCSDHGKPLFHSIFRALFLTLKEYVNDAAFQPVFLNSFLALEDQMKCRNILRPCFSDRKMYRPQQCLDMLRAWQRIDGIGRHCWWWALLSSTEAILFIFWGYKKYGLVQELTHRSRWWNSHNLVLLGLPDM